MSKIYAIVISCGVVAVLGGGAAFFFHTQEKKDTPKKEGPSNFFFTLAPLIVNLKATEDKKHILKVTFVIESDSETDKNKINYLQPIILDQFQVYLRDIEMRDLEGSTGLERIRQELFSRLIVIGKSSGVNMKNILFKEFIIS